MRNHLLSTTAVFAPVDTDRGSEPASQRPRVRAAHPQREDRRAGVRRQRPVTHRQNDDSDDDADRQRREAEKRRKQANREKRRATIADNPLRLYRPGTVAELLSVDQSTLWRWRRDGLIEEPIKVGGIIGWTHEQLQRMLKGEAR